MISFDNKIFLGDFQGQMQSQIDGGARRRFFRAAAFTFKASKNHKAFRNFNREVEEVEEVRKKSYEMISFYSTFSTLWFIFLQVYDDFICFLKVRKVNAGALLYTVD
jgi:hypothetical protein